MVYENINITEEELSNNPDLCLNIVDGDFMDEIIDKILSHKSIEFVDDTSQANMFLECPTSADGYELFTFTDSNYRYDLYENVFISQDGVIEKVFDYIVENDSFNLYSEIDKEDIFCDEDTIWDLADELGIIMRDDVEMIGEVDNPTFDEWVFVFDYDRREEELDRLYEEEHSRVEEEMEKDLEDGVNQIKNSYLQILL